MTIRILLARAHMVVRKGFRTFLKYDPEDACEQDPLETGGAEPHPGHPLCDPHRPGLTWFGREDRVANVECQFIEHVPPIDRGVECGTCNACDEAPPGFLSRSSGIPPCGVMKLSLLSLSPGQPPGFH